ncbi:permeability factor 2-like [Hyperolius riggenbachi]|uniref:permeability factor 2-like n=1 Tax=Hyperolius riggenbachi TaxID=752182 RepID=UPI0035A35D5E
MNCCGIAILCIVLSAALIEGFAAPKGERCSCRVISNKLNLKKTLQLDIYSPGPNCPREEYLVTVQEKKGKQKRRCVSPAIKEVKSILKGKATNKQGKKIQVIRHGSA